MRDLCTALVSNRRTGMAIGILMASRRISEQAASDLLRQASQSRNVELQELAEEVTWTGTLR
ncbi:ANTAR domain-containing protein [Geodermatophilus marinus]|nr:ANTAR domain-containing protein [Geodermatophilus sp. LHW52908]